MGNVLYEVRLCTEVDSMDLLLRTTARKIGPPQVPREFTPAHADSQAINHLESMAYFQKKRSLDDYLDEFQDLITDAWYTDPKTTVVKFRRGFDPQIQDVVATMAAGRPSDTNPDAWYSMAWMVDQNRAANEAFQSAAAPPPESVDVHNLTVNELHELLSHRLTELEVVHKPAVSVPVPVQPSIGFPTSKRDLQK